MSRVQTNLASIRKARGLGAADLAKRVGITRQTVYAIEAGTYLPNTEVTLKLARELEVTVEELFSLPPQRQEACPNSAKASTWRPGARSSIATTSRWRCKRRMASR